MATEAKVVDLLFQEVLKRGTMMAVTDQAFADGKRPVDHILNNNKFLMTLMAQIGDRKNQLDLREGAKSSAFFSFAVAKLAVFFRLMLISSGAIRSIVRGVGVHILSLKGWDTVEKKGQKSVPLCVVTTDNKPKKKDEHGRPAY